MFWKKKSRESPQREIFLTRIHSAPCDLAWLFWTEPEMLRLWWLPEGFKNPFSSACGLPLISRQEPQSENLISFLQVERPSRFIFQCKSSPVFQAELTFKNQIKTTQVSFRAEFTSESEFERVRHIAMMGCKQKFSAVDEQIAALYRTNTPPQMLLLEREIDASRELIWKFWTDPALFSRWWFPWGMRLAQSAIDLKPGGAFHFCVSSPEGVRNWTKFEFEQVEIGHRLVMRSFISDASGAICAHPLNSRWPREFAVDIALRKCHDKIMLTLHTWPVNANKFEVEFFNERFPLLQTQWTNSLERLEHEIAAFRKEKWAPRPEARC
jgi:uncharacterized protein YndB with AHSA1/START domain